MDAWLSFEFGAAARRPDGKMKGAANPANVVVCKKRRREREREIELLVSGRLNKLVIIGGAERNAHPAELKRDSSCRQVRAPLTTLQASPMRTRGRRVRSKDAGRRHSVS